MRDCSEFAVIFDTVVGSAIEKVHSIAESLQAPIVSIAFIHYSVNFPSSLKF